MSSTVFFFLSLLNFEFSLTICQNNNHARFRIVLLLILFVTSSGSGFRARITSVDLRNNGNRTGSQSWENVQDGEPNRNDRARDFNRGRSRVERHQLARQVERAHALGRTIPTSRAITALDAVF